MCDLAKGHISALEKCFNDSGIHTYNLGTGKGVSVLELINAFEKTNNIKINYKVVSRRDGDIRESYADVTKVKKELNWSSAYSVSDMCRDAWNWQKKNPRSYK